MVNSESKYILKYLRSRTWKTIVKSRMRKLIHESTNQVLNSLHVYNYPDFDKLDGVGGN